MHEITSERAPLRKTSNSQTVTGGEGLSSPIVSNEFMVRKLEVESGLALEDYLERLSKSGNPSVKISLFCKSGDFSTLVGSQDFRPVSIVTDALSVEIKNDKSFEFEDAEYVGWEGVWDGSDKTKPPSGRRYFLQTSLDPRIFKKRKDKVPGADNIYTG